MDPLEYLFSLEKLGIKFGLANIRDLCAALGSPQDAFRSVLIGGTNGKGSVTAMVERALRAAGVRTARFTSPHLVRLEERFFVNGATVDTSAMRDAAGVVRRAVERLVRDGTLEGRPTFFEVTTAMAFELFRQAGADVAVLEVGLGGRLDSTNVVSPIATAITSIDLDHQALLGSTLSQIAAEKAGIAKSGVPLVLGDTKPDVVDAIARMCHEQGAPLIHAESGVHARTTLGPDGRLTLALTTPTREYAPVTLALRGRHQARNAITAVRLLERLGLDVPASAILTGLREVVWPGRLDVLDVAPGRSLVLDSAHNPAGAAALAAYLIETHGDPLPIVFAAMRDKDAEGMLVALRPCARAFVFTTPNLSRAMPAEELATLAARVAPGLPALTAASPQAALERAWQLAPRVCACGSIFLVGHVLELTGSRV